jgi:hypothetical protein
MILPQSYRCGGACEASGHNVANPRPASPATALRLWWIALCVIIVTASTSTLRAGAITIPNQSFESPGTTYAVNLVDSWQQTPDPSFFLTGVFSNQPPVIDNCDGNQAAFLWANPGVSLSQDYDSTDWSSSIPSHAFDARFNAGSAYNLTVGVIGGVDGTPPLFIGATLQLSLYYRDAASNVVTVAATTITNSAQLFPSNTHLVDFSVQVPGVLPTDPWANQHIGVQIASTVAPELAGGYWDLDNVRLTETILPALSNPQVTNTQFRLTLQSLPGLRCEILAHTNLASPLANWTNLCTVTNTTGTTNFLDPAANLDRRFYRARQLQ